MKKKILYALLLLLIGLLLAYVFRYKTGPCLCHTIPKDAEAVVLVKVRNLEKHILHDVVSHPMSYLSSDKEVERDTFLETSDLNEIRRIRPSLTDCISIPKAVVLYKKNDRWFSSKVKVKNQMKLEAYLKNRNMVEASNGKSVIYKLGQRHVYINDGSMQVSYGSKQNDAIESSYLEDDYMTKGDVLFDAVTNSIGGSSSDVNYVDGKNQQLLLSFNKGSVNIKGDYDLDFLLPSTSVVQTSGIGALSATLDLEKLKAFLTTEQIDKFSNFTKLEVDSLQEHWDGSFKGVLQDFSTSSDTIKTYEYDDDFNKVEVQKVEQVISPDFIVQLGMNPQGVSYMKRKNAIVEQDGADILAIMPLVKTYATSSDKTLSLFTNEVELSARTSDDKLIGFMDVQKLISSTEDDALPFSGQLASMKDIRISVSNEDEVDVIISFISKRNALASLIFGQ